MEAAASRGAVVLMRVYFVLLLAFLYVPIALLALFSFNSGDPTFPFEDFTTHWYTDVFGNDALIGSLIRARSWRRYRASSRSPSACSRPSR
jgi:ABC-type spermidine/putrescine transport system permease subunit II